MGERGILRREISPLWPTAVILIAIVSLIMAGKWAVSPVNKPRTKTKAGEDFGGSDRKPYVQQLNLRPDQQRIIHAIYVPDAHLTNDLVTLARQRPNSDSVEAFFDKAPAGAYFSPTMVPGHGAVLSASSRYDPGDIFADDAYVIWFRIALPESAIDTPNSVSHFPDEASAVIYYTTGFESRLTAAHAGSLQILERTPQTVRARITAYALLSWFPDRGPSHYKFVGEFEFHERSLDYVTNARFPKGHNRSEPELWSTYRQMHATDVTGAGSAMEAGTEQ